MNDKILLSWSGGKDSSLVLYELLKGKNTNIISLLTTVTEDYNRISMHGVRKELLEYQAESIGFNLNIVMIPKNASNEEYENKMRLFLKKLLERGLFKVAFGDIFLEDLRRYREEKLSLLGIQGVFPLWKRNTLVLANIFIDLGFKAIITSVDSQFLGKEYVGRLFNKQFLSELPNNVDPCGENGEFHSFVYDGPIFKNKISFTKGDIVLREDRFYFCDLLEK